MGFEVDLLSARVYKNGESSPELDHLTLRVRLEDDRLVDVGFGDNLLKPLKLFETGAKIKSGVAYRVGRNLSDWELLEMDEKGGWKCSYCFDLLPRQLSDYKENCTYHRASSNSHFTQTRLCTRATPEGRITLSGRRLNISNKGLRREMDLNDENEYHSALERFFRIRLSGF